MACPWGSIINGHLLADVTMTPFSVEKLSLGSPWIFQSRTFVGLAMNLQKSNVGSHGTPSFFTWKRNKIECSHFIMLCLWFIGMDQVIIEPCYKLGDNCIQNFHLGRYIIWYMVGYLVLWLRTSGAIKHDFRTYIQRYTSPNKNCEYGYPHSNALLQCSIKLGHCKPNKSARRPTKCDIINYI